MKTKLGQVSMGLIITSTLAVAGWLAAQVYTNLDSRISGLEVQNEAFTADISSIQTNIEWIKQSLQAKGFSPDTASTVIKAP